MKGIPEIWNDSVNTMQWFSSVKRFINSPKYKANLEN